MCCMCLYVVLGRGCCCGALVGLFLGWLLGPTVTAAVVYWWVELSPGPGAGLGHGRCIVLVGGAGPWTSCGACA